MFICMETPKVLIFGSVLQPLRLRSLDWINSPELSTKQNSESTYL